MSKEFRLDDPKFRAKVEKAARRERRQTHLFLHTLHIMERSIAAVTVLALLGSLGIEVYHMFTDGPEYFRDVSHMLHDLLSIVVGLEFVRMLIDTTPSNVLEVLTLAITRHVILSHDDPMSNVASISCIAGLFAIRRFLVRQEELKEEMVEVE